MDATIRSDVTVKYQLNFFLIYRFASIHIQPSLYYYGVLLC